jgi:hypothetical protein
MVNAHLFRRVLATVRFRNRTSAATRRKSRRTCALLTEATEGGRGIAGRAYGREEFAALAAAAAKN